MTSIDVRNLLEYLDYHIALADAGKRECREKNNPFEVLRYEGALVAYKQLREGVYHQISNDKGAICPFCGGRGMAGECPARDHEHKTCDRCDGAGIFAPGDEVHPRA